MYLVVKYFNYRKDVSFSVLKICDTLNNAKSYAKSYAEDALGEDITEGVKDSHVTVDRCYIEYTKGHGYSEFVYAVIGHNSEDTSYTTSFNG